ncbi:MAG: DUF2793 domain-containing protein [Mesorhizobium sp.]
MDTTANLSLPYIMPSQAQKHVTHNESLRMLDAIVQLSVLDRDLAAPPSSPAEGDRYIVAQNATGAWEGAAGRIAVWQDGGWAILDPRQGWTAWVVDEKALVCWDGSSWAGVTGAATALQNLALLGVGTAADVENTFAAKLNKALWAARETGEGGDGDLRYTLNKQSPANVLSLLMQSNWSGRAEIGLIGDDDLTLKISSDGSNWKEALKVDRQKGRVSFPNSNFLTDYAISLYSDSGRFGGNTAKGTATGDFSWPSYLTAYNGSTVESAGRFISNNNDYGGTAGNLPTDMKDLVDMIRDPSRRRYGIEFYAARLTMGSGRSTSSIVVDGVEYYISLHTDGQARPPSMTFHAYVKALDSTVAVRCYPGQTILKNGIASSTHVPIAPSEGWVPITILDQQDPRTTYGYTPGPFTLACASTGDRWLLSCPALMGGLTILDDNIGLVPGVSQWLA